MKTGSARSYASCLQTRLLFSQKASGSADLNRLRQTIRALERHAPLPAGKCAAHPAPLWSFGVDEIDHRLAPEGLDSAALHEVKPQTAGATCHAHAIGFIVRLLVRRLNSLSSTHGTPQRILWCWPRSAAREMGNLYGPGLAHLGLDPATLLIVETARAGEALWALEEGLKSKSLAIAVGVLPAIALTPARRLALAAQEHTTPALLLTQSQTCPAAATATRWRISTQQNAPHPFDAAAPGSPRLGVTLERCRGRPECESLFRILEWSDETHRFRLAPPVAHRADAPKRAAGGYGTRRTL